MFDKNVFLRDTLRLVTAEIKRFEVDNRVEASTRLSTSNLFISAVTRRKVSRKKTFLSNIACLSSEFI